MIYRYIAIDMYVMMIDINEVHKDAYGMVAMMAMMGYGGVQGRVACICICIYDLFPFSSTGWFSS
jgi:hypothetical protein